MERIVMQPFVLVRGHSSSARPMMCLKASRSPTGIQSRALVRKVGLLPHYSHLNSQMPSSSSTSLLGKASVEHGRRYSSAAAATAPFKHYSNSDYRQRYQQHQQQQQHARQQQQQQQQTITPPKSSSLLSSAPITTPTPAAPLLTSKTISEGIDVDTSIMAQAPLELSAEQRFLLDQVINKKRSVFFTGSAGTGKSVLLRQLIEELKEVYQPGQVAVTASTGIAACNIGGCTLHSFAGVGLGAGTVDQLLAKLTDNRRARGRWRRVRVLIIDEVSMIDGDLFDKLEAIARKMKRSEKPFGGIQLIITGDFFQLPPVAKDTFSLQPTPSASSSSIIPRIRGSRSTTTIIKKAAASSPSLDNKSNATGPFEGDPFSEASFDDKYCNFDTAPPLYLLDPEASAEASASPASQPTLCFDAQTWSTCIRSTLQLTEVFRQRDPAFIKMLTEMRHGKLSEETCHAFKGLERTPKYPDDGIKATELFALRRQVDEANRRHLASLPGPMHVYEPRDDGPLKAFMDKACTAPSKLELKENAQVMLIKNLTPTLVNGSMGLVVGFQDDMSYDQESGQWQKSHFPVVRFQGEDDDLVIKPEEWRMELPNGEVMASRIQVPLILSWAMSIHKSQGQTMERLKVDMGKIFEAGQAYVALSRATSLAGLQVLNFNKRSVQAHDRVAEFYDSLLTVQDMMAQELNKATKKKPRRHSKKAALEQSSSL